MNEAENKVPEPVKPSFAVDQIRKEYERDCVNAEDHGRALSDHIRAVDEEIKALCEERGRLSEQLLKATEVMVAQSEEFRAVATNDYRANGNSPVPSRY
jgi:predicted  nucleic acid-binding Zn-ribbon protein